MGGKESKELAAVLPLAKSADVQSQRRAARTFNDLVFAKTGFDREKLLDSSVMPTLVHLLHSTDPYVMRTFLKALEHVISDERVQVAFCQTGMHVKLIELTARTESNDTSPLARSCLERLTKIPDPAPQEAQHLAQVGLDLIIQMIHSPATHLQRYACLCVAHLSKYQLLSVVNCPICRSLVSWCWRCIECGVECCDACYRRADVLGPCPRTRFHEMSQMKAGLNLVEDVLALFDSPDKRVQNAVARAIAEMSVYEEMQMEIVRHRGIVLLIILSLSDDPETQLCVARAIRNLAQHEQNKRTIVEEGGLQALVHLADTRNTEIERYVVTALLELCGREDLRVVCAGQATKSLLEVATVDDQEIQTAAANALALLAETPNVIAILVDNGVIPLLLRLARSPYKDARRAAVKCIADLLSNDKARVSAVRLSEEDGVPRLLELLANSESDVYLQRSAARALALMAEADASSLQRYGTRCETVLRQCLGVRTDSEVRSYANSIARIVAPHLLGTKSDTPSQPLALPDQVKLKCHMLDEIRVVSVSPTMKFSELLQMLSALYNTQVLVQYEDVEGDAITVRSQPEWAEALAAHVRRGLPYLHLFLSVPNQGGTPVMVTRGHARKPSEASTKSSHSRITPKQAMQQVRPPTSSPYINTHSEMTTSTTTSAMSNLSMSPSTHGDVEQRMMQHSTLQIRYQKGNLLGQGAYGEVYLGLRNTGELLAVKQVKLPQHDGADYEEQVEALEREIQVMRSLQHEHIVQYLGSERSHHVLTIFMEYVPGGSIRQLLRKFGRFNEHVIRRYTRQIIEGLAYLHSQGIMHRDIKGDNILVSETGSVKLADFNCARRIQDIFDSQDKRKSLQGTVYFMAPEVIQQRGHDFKADIWSVGCTVIEMATGNPPFSQISDVMAAMFHIVTSDDIPLPEELSPEGRDFCRLCLKRDPENRPSAEELLNHQFLLDTMYTEPAFTATAEPENTLSPPVVDEEDEKIRMYLRQTLKHVASINSNLLSNVPFPQGILGDVVPAAPTPSLPTVPRQVTPPTTLPRTSPKQPPLPEPLIPLPPPEPLKPTNSPLPSLPEVPKPPSAGSVISVTDPMKLASSQHVPFPSVSTQDGMYTSATATSNQSRATVTPRKPSVSPIEPLPLVSQPPPSQRPAPIEVPRNAPQAVTRAPLLGSSPRGSPTHESIQELSMRLPPTNLGPLQRHTPRRWQSAQPRGSFDDDALMFVASDQVVQATPTPLNRVRSNTSDGLHMPPPRVHTRHYSDGDTLTFKAYDSNEFEASLMSSVMPSRVASPRPGSPSNFASPLSSPLRPFGPVPFGTRPFGSSTADSSPIATYVSAQPSSNSNSSTETAPLPPLVPHAPSSAPLSAWQPWRPASGVSNRAKPPQQKQEQPQEQKHSPL